MCGCLHPDDVNASDKRDIQFAVSVATSPYVPLERSLSAALAVADVVPFYDLG